MFRRLWLFGGVLVLTGSLVLMTAEPGRAAGPGGGVFQRGGGFGGSPGAGMRAGSGFTPRTSTYPPLGYRPSRLYPYYRYNYNYGLYPYYNQRSTTYSYSSGYGELPDYSEYTEPYNQGTPSYGQTYPSGGRAPAGAAEAEQIAHLTVNVPAGAEVWFDKFKTTSTGPVREFKTPPLSPGKYGYMVRARWREDGHEVTQTRDVTLSPGADIQLTFPLPSGSQEEGGKARER